MSFLYILFLWRYNEYDADFGIFFTEKEYVSSLFDYFR